MKVDIKVIIIVVMSIVLIPQIPLIPVILLSQVVNGFLLPVVLVFILRLSSRRDLMGEYRNHFAFNIIASLV